MFATPRWKILETLAMNPSSPVELSKKMKTSVAYVSQQLRLLETAGLLDKVKTGKVEAGKPRSVFSVIKEIAFLTLLVKNTPIKRPIYMTEKSKILLRIWAIENREVVEALEEFYFLIGSNLKDINAIFFDSGLSSIYVVSSSKGVASKVAGFSKEYKGKISANVISEDSLTVRKFGNLIVLYDLTNLASKIKPVVKDE